MQKTITKSLILTAVLVTALGVNYLFAAWAGPTQAPTGGNTSTPVHIGSTDQVKDGGLSLDGLSVFGGGYFQGSVGVGVVTPTEALEVDGGAKISEGLQIGNSTNVNAGTIRWTGTDFEGHDGTQWVSLVSGEAAVTVDPNYTDCINAGGSWVDSQSTCYFPGTSCPSGWSKNANYSSAQGNSCTGSAHPACRADSCSVPGYIRVNSTPQSCTYTFSIGLTDSVCWQQWTGQGYTGSCSATQTEVGCTKN